MKLRWIPGEYRYVVAVADGSDLWLTLWVKRSAIGEFFVMLPRKSFINLRRGVKDWNPHTSYHLDGNLHMKSYDDKVLPPQKCQPLTATFKGIVDFGTYAGHDPKSVGERCDPTAFSGIVRVPPGVLDAHNGVVKVDLVEPGHVPGQSTLTQIVIRQVFFDIVPWVVITVGHCAYNYKSAVGR